MTNPFLRRSTLIMPADQQTFIDKALDRGADAIQLDLEDGVARSEKNVARKNLKENIDFVSRGEVEVLVRINQTFDDAKQDLDAAIHKGLDGIVIPKVEDIKTVIQMESLVRKLEQKRGLVANHIQFTILIETAKGFMNIKEILKSSKRIIAVNLGTEDFTLDIGIEPSREGQELLFPKLYTMIAAKSENIQPLGLIGSMADFKDLDNLFKIARNSYLHGHVGASCIHPSQVPILNKAFSPTSNEVEYAKKVIEVFEEATDSGQGAVSFNGKMIDLPVAGRAYRILEKDRIIKLKKHN